MAFSVASLPGRFSLHGVPLLCVRLVSGPSAFLVSVLHLHFLSPQVNKRSSLDPAPYTRSGDSCLRALCIWSAQPDGLPEVGFRGEDGHADACPAAAHPGALAGAVGWLGHWYAGRAIGDPERSPWDLGPRPEPGSWYGSTWPTFFTHLFSKIMEIKMLKALHRPRAPRGSSLSSWPGLVTSWQLRGRTAKGRRGRGPSVLSGPWP